MQFLHFHEFLHHPRRPFGLVQAAFLWKNIAHEQPVDLGPVRRAKISGQYSPQEARGTFSCALATIGTDWSLSAPVQFAIDFTTKNEKFAAALDDGSKDPYLGKACDAFAHPPMQRTNRMIPERFKSAGFLAAHIAALATVALLINYGNNIRFEAMNMRMDSLVESSNQRNDILQSQLQILIQDNRELRSIILDFIVNQGRSSPDIEAQGSANIE